jgi:hypothetical protein
VHFIDAMSMARKFFVLSTKPVVLELHTASDVISKGLKETMKDYAIPLEKIQIVMRDAASSLKLGTADTDPGDFESCDCFTHKFHLVCQFNVKCSKKIIFIIKSLN